MLSKAVGSERVSKVVGYELAKGNFATQSPNLPQRVAIIGEANAANQSSLVASAGRQILSAQEAGQLYGFGSPIHMAARILFPQQGNGIGGIPVVVYPQAAAGGAVARVQTVTVTGTATASGTHYLKIAGRTSLDGVPYAVNIVSGDTQNAIAAKMRDAVNAVLGCPLSATAATNVATATAKWAGLTSQDVSITVDTNGTSLGITYAVAETAAGSGTPAVGPSLDLFGAEWNTIVLNTYGTASTVLAALEAYNGIPDPANPTGRFSGIIMKPFVAITGSTADDPTSITDTRAANVTIAIAPAPLSAGLPLEAAANMTVIYARTAQDTPHLDVSGQAYPDMPAPAGTPAMTSYNVRDAYVKKGCSTVDLVGGVYVVEDFVTTYHPTGETPPQFRYVRNLYSVDMNIRYGYLLREQTHVLGHVIAADNDVVSASQVIKPKQWVGILKNYASELGERALIADVAFMQGNIQTGLSSTNPDRLETLMRYKRSGTVRIASTTAQAGFNFGTA